uniref:Uncharacterized protein n=2 Tax=Picea TaxID=3328 RepID=A0A101LXF3_PICGL|nr:hypothetical protein ABT39_MTgene6123 [Picea glauca]QHR92578.1 hypothetical protein Q903MT_gene6624 [Picea sitchensis]
MGWLPYVSMSSKARKSRTQVHLLIIPSTSQLTPLQTLTDEESINPIMRMEESKLCPSLFRHSPLLFP